MPIYLYSKKELEKLDAFIAKEFGEYQNVFHEIVSPDIHLDVAIIPPSQENPYYKLVTMGAGAYKMNIPKGLKKKPLERAEYVIFLPKDWNLQSDAEEHYWPVRALKSVARLPVTCGSWLAYGHTVSANEDASPFAPNTKLNSIVLLAAFNKNHDVVPSLKLGLLKEVNFYGLFPLYQEELDFKMEHSLDDLLDRMLDEFNPVVDISRKNFCASEKQTPGDKEILP